MNLTHRLHHQIYKLVLVLAGWEGFKSCSGTLGVYYMSTTWTQLNNLTKSET